MQPCWSHRPADTTCSPPVVLLIIVLFFVGLLPLLGLLFHPLPIISALAHGRPAINPARSVVTTTQSCRPLRQSRSCRSPTQCMSSAAPSAAAPVSEGKRATPHSWDSRLSSSYSSPNSSGGCTPPRSAPASSCSGVTPSPNNASLVSWSTDSTPARRTVPISIPLAMVKVRVAVSARSCCVRALLWAGRSAGRRSTNGWIERRELPPLDALLARAPGWEGRGTTPHLDMPLPACVCNRGGDGRRRRAGAALRVRAAGQAPAAAACRWHPCRTPDGFHPPPGLRRAPAARRWL